LNPEKKQSMIAVEIFNVLLSDKGFVILLKSKDDNKALPISIGQLEAQSIIIALSEAVPARPLTHDLMKNLLDELSCEVKRVEVCSLIDDTFHGRIILDHNGLPVELDSRPSDAIALAVRTGADIFVDEKVMEKGKITLDTNESGQIETEENINTEANSTTTIDDLKSRLDEAVKLEHYEKAAGIRDEIRKRNTSN
jgi:bifunctional DNase/RNase